MDNKKLIKEAIRLNLKKYRKEKELTQEELAKKIGMKNTAVSAWESGRNSIDIETLLEICEVLNITLNDMYSISAENTSMFKHAINADEHSDIFAQKIKGHSMEPRIYDGDIAIVHRQNDIESGEIAVIRVKDDVTTKKIVKQENGVLLVGLNTAAFTPEFYPYEDVEILGKVIEVRGKMDGWEK